MSASKIVKSDQVNVARVLQMLREERRCSRTDLVRRTGLSAATISQITNDLIGKRLLRSAGTQSTGRGRPVEILEYVADARFALGIEVHGEGVYGVKTDLFAKPIRDHHLGPVASSSEAVIDSIVQWVDEVMADESAADCIGIGIALPGLVDQRSGEVKFSTEFNLSQVPAVDLLERRLSSRPVATNRTYAAAMAESWLGAAKDIDHLVYVRVENSLGGAILIDRLPYWGSNSAAGSIAHIPVQPNGLPCRCGSSGCLDTVASGAAIERRTREEIRRGRSSVLLDGPGGLNEISADRVLRAAEGGDQVSIDVITETCEWLGVALAGCVNMLGPGMIVLGGHLGRVGGDMLAGLVDDHTRPRVYAMTQPDYSVTGTTVGEDAIACGAAATALLATVSQSVSLHSPLG